MAMHTFVIASSVAGAFGGAPWYQGIDSITVLAPPPKPDVYLLQREIDSIYHSMDEDAFGNASAFQKGQFGVKRRAILLKSGDYGSLTVPVHWYTTVMGVGLGPQDVIIQNLESKDDYPGTVKGSLEAFWKSVEGVTTTAKSTLWAVSQAAPIRRCNINGDLWLSETDERDGTFGKHYTSGVFLADLKVGGNVSWGSQQQFFFRNSDMPNVNYTAAGMSMVFVGVKGAPSYNESYSRKPLIVNHHSAPLVAEKPYLVEVNNDWFILVPEVEREKVGASSGSQFRMIPMGDVFVAKEGDTSEDIQKGIIAKHCRAVLFTPAIYGLSKPIYINKPDFVVLGIGLPTLVATHGLSALVIDREAHGVRVAQVLLEAGTALTVDATEPLLTWRGNNGIASDLFARVGVFAYETSFHTSCLVTKADVMVWADGDGMIFDNAWLWHADHDDCTAGLGTDHADPPKSDEAFSATGLIVNGNDVISYGMAVEHTKHDMVRWEGENGQVFFFQSELPYSSNLNFGKEAWSGFKVAYGVKEFTGYGIGIYQVFNTYSMNTSFRISPSSKLTNIFTWCITSNRSGLGSLACTSPGLGQCTAGDCDSNSCLLLSWPPHGPHNISTMTTPAQMMDSVIV